MSRNLCEWAQLALDQRALTAILTRSSAVDSAPHPTPPPFCWLAPWAPICAQAELILGPWNNNYRSYSQSIDTEWATNSPAAHPLLQSVSKHKFKLLEDSAPIRKSCTASILSGPSYIQDTPVAVVAPPPSLAGVSLRKYPCIVPPLFIAQQ